jgi:hypothetical protein
MKTSHTLTLYHGAIHEFDRIIVNQGQPNKDFGGGFYASRTERDAIAVAERSRQMKLERAAEAGIDAAVSAWVCSCEFDRREMDKLNVKEFPEVDREWAEFIFKNRRSRNSLHDYDLVIGPTADDDASVVIGAMLLGFYGDSDSDIAMETCLRLIEPKKLPRQTFSAVRKRPIC